MYREFTVKDEEGLKMVFRVYPELSPPHTNEIVYKKFEIPMTLETKRALVDMIGIVNKFMGGNTIDKLEVVEKEEL